MSKFSASLKLTDLDDFITPSQACIKPVPTPKVENVSQTARIPLEIDGSESQPPFPTTKAAHITLNDCLACSGCVTSAESILIEQQRPEELYKVLNDNNTGTNKQKYVVVSIAPQCRASFAAKYQLSSMAVMRKLTWYFMNFLKVDLVLDTTFSRDFSLIESAEEFLERKSNLNLPMLVATCPGWVCYAEKTHGEHILPFLCTTKSPQQVMGSIVKTVFASVLRKTSPDIYHVTVMPCFDKKLEASRPDFEQNGVRDVDCVITSMEVEAMLEDHNFNIATMQERDLIDTWGVFDAVLDHLDCSQHLESTYVWPTTEKLRVTDGSGSGGYLDFIMKYSVYRLTGQQIDQIVCNPGKNIDIFEAEYTPIQGACMNGFRNIQNLVRKIKLKKCTYDIVEVMACPSGCLNGGGQLRVDAKDVKEHMKRVEAAYREGDVYSPLRNTTFQRLSGRLQLHTKYHAVQKLSNVSLGVKW